MHPMVSPPHWIRLLLSLVCFVLLPLFGTVPAAIGYTDGYTLFQDHYEAMGGLEKLKAVKTTFSRGRIRYDGLRGSFTSWEESPLKHRTEEDYGIIKQIDGDNGEYSWFVDPNGQLLKLLDQETVKRRQIGELLERFAHLDPNSPVFSLRLGDDTIIDAISCYQVIIDNSINTDRYRFFFDKSNLYMIRAIARRPDSTITTDYSDFRWTDGILVPFHSFSRYQPWGTEEEVWTEYQEFNLPIDGRLFQPPVPSRDYSFPPGTDSVSVDLLIVENQLYIPVTVKGDTRYWLLDSGASMSVIDRDYLKALDLRSSGRIAGYGFGENFSLGFARLPAYQVGDLKIDGQTIYTSEGLRERSYEPEIYGVAGYDLLSRFVVEIDYDNARVTFHNPQTFHYRGEGVVIDAPLKYRTFSLPLRLEDRPEGLWSLDLGAFRSSLHLPYARKHGFLNRKGVETVSQGMSGIVHERLARFNRVQIGPFRLDNQLLAIPDESSSGAATRGETDGNLGNRTLKNFHLFLDYPKQRLILEKGLRFNQPFPVDRSGALLGRSALNQPMVSFVAPDTPADRSGLKAGDIILRMQGESIGPATQVMKLRQILQGPIGERVEMVLLREGREFRTELVLEELLPAGRVSQ